MLISPELEYALKRAGSTLAASPVDVLDIQAIQNMLEEARKEERERCARIADVWANTRPTSGPNAPLIASVTRHTEARIAAAIRELT